MYEDDIKIDENALEQEWLEQPRLMMKYAQIAAQARMDYDFAKEHVNIVKAGLDRRIRKDPDKFEIEKLTETAVFNTIQQHLDMRAVTNDMLQAKYEFDMATAAVQAFEQKKSALENLVRLHGQQYFAGPRVPRDISEERKLKQVESNKKIKFKRRKT